MLADNYLKIFLVDALDLTVVLQVRKTDLQDAVP